MVPAECCELTASCAFRTVDCTAHDDASLDFCVPFRLTAAAAGVATSFVIHFDTLFDLSKQGGKATSFTTSPLHTPTHWKQASLYLNAPLKLQEGDVVAGTIAFSRGIDYKRAYDITMSFEVPRGGGAVTQLWRIV